MIRKTVFFFLCLLQLSLALHAKDFGTHGIIALIEEEDPIVLIQSKLKMMEGNGELARHHRELQQRAKKSIERPKPVESITNARESRVFYYDPTYVVGEDLKDHAGRIFYKKGTKINPLEAVNLSHNLLFIDGDDADQVAFAKEKLKERPVKLILIKGAPLVLSEGFKALVYFDQGGFLTKKLGIKHIPALVSQKSLRLRIEEIQLKGETNEK